MSATLEIFRVANGFVIRSLDDNARIMCEPSRSKTYVAYDVDDLRTQLPRIIEKHMPHPKACEAKAGTPSA